MASGTPVESLRRRCWPPAWHRALYIISPKCCARGVRPSVYAGHGRTPHSDVGRARQSAPPGVTGRGPRHAARASGGGRAGPRAADRGDALTSRRGGGRGRRRPPPIRLSGSHGARQGCRTAPCPTCCDGSSARRCGPCKTSPCSARSRKRQRLRRVRHRRKEKGCFSRRCRGWPAPGPRRPAR